MRALLTTLLLTVALTGCGFALRALGRNLVAPLTPRPVHNKLHDARRPDARLSVLWIGHATALVQLDDKFVLTDPVFTSSVGSISRRLVEPGMDPADLPPLAAIVISHTHLDHLSFDSLAMVEHKTQQLLLPEGARANMPRYAFSSRELPPWQSVIADGVRITAVPVRHFGGRFGLDLAMSPRSFTGYVIEYHGLSVYFGGDTAFDAALFRATRSRFEELDLALLPICPNRPRDYMRQVHMGPGEALEAFELLGAAHMVPVHYDTFVNSDDQFGDCPRELRRARDARRLTESQVAILDIGEQRVFVPRH